MNLKRIIKGIYIKKEDQMKKKLLAGLLGLAIIMGSGTVLSADYKNHKIQWLTEKNYVIGRKEASNLELDQRITRAEFTKMALVIKGEEQIAKQSNKKGLLFYDVPEHHWAKSYIDYASEKGYIKGNGDHSFRPNQSITYEEMIAIIVRTKPDFVENKREETYWAGPYIEYAKRNGILRESTEEINLKEPAVRGFAFEIVYNSMNPQNHDQKEEKDEKKNEKRQAEIKKGKASVPAVSFSPSDVGESGGGGQRGSHSSSDEGKGGSSSGADSGDKGSQSSPTPDDGVVSDPPISQDESGAGEASPTPDDDSANNPPVPPDHQSPNAPPKSPDQGDSENTSPIGMVPLKDPYDLFIEKVKEEFDREYGQYRQEHGIAVLPLDERLAKGSGIRTKEMAETNYYEHRRPSGESFATAFEGLAGKVGLGENIWYMKEGPYAQYVLSFEEGYARSIAKKILNTFDQSPKGHREAQLNTKWTGYYIELTRAKNGNMYVAMHFIED